MVGVVEEEEEEEFKGEVLVLGVEPSPPPPFASAHSNKAASHCMEMDKLFTAHFKAPILDMGVHWDTSRRRD
jgi:hypothetical protein